MVMRVNLSPARLPKALEPPAPPNAPARPPPLPRWISTSRIRKMPRTRINVFRTGGGHAAAILNRKRSGRFLAEHFADSAAEEGVGLLRLLRRGGLTGADGPDRLIGKHHLRQVVRGQSREAAGQLRLHYHLGPVRLPLL